MQYDYKNVIDIDGTLIGNDNPCYIIAEIGINHNGNVVLAKKLIDVATSAGANAVKFQKRDLESIYRQEILENPSLDSQGTEILIDVLKNVEFSEGDFQDIVNYCKEKKNYLSLHTMGYTKCKFPRKVRCSCIQNCICGLDKLPVNCSHF
tara:strand:+ start:27 stop:476 length:450 start_codon:yes stop_codon:yes gene_type:complete